MRSLYVQQTVARCFAVLRQLRSIQRSVPTSVFHTLVVVLSKLDNGHATLVGHQENLLGRPQFVLDAAARSIASLRRSTHIKDTLASFHWLRAPERIKFKLAVFVYRALYETPPRYLSDQLSGVADMSRSRLRSRLVTILENDYLLLLARSYGTVFRTTLYLLHHFSAKTENTFISAVITGRYYVACLWLFSPWW